MNILILDETGQRYERATETLPPSYKNINIKIESFKTVWKMPGIIPSNFCDKRICRLGWRVLY